MAITAPAVETEIESSWKSPDAHPWPTPNGVAKGGKMTHTTGIEEKIEQKVPARQHVSLARIMAATDFSPASNRALDYAVSLARRFGSQIYLTHVITYKGHGVMEAGAGAPAGEELRRITHAQAQEVVDSGRLYGVPYEVVIERGRSGRRSRVCSRSTRLTCSSWARTG